MPMGDPGGNFENSGGYAGTGNFNSGGGGFQPGGSLNGGRPSYGGVGGTNGIGGMMGMGGPMQQAAALAAQNGGGGNPNGLAQQMSQLPGTRPPPGVPVVNPPPNMIPTVQPYGPAGPRTYADWAKDMNYGPVNSGNLAIGQLSPQGGFGGLTNNWGGGLQGNVGQGGSFGGPGPQANAGGLFGGGRQMGGPVMPDQAYMVGERGPEMFRPQVPGNIVPNTQLSPPGVGARGISGMLR